MEASLLFVKSYRNEVIFVTHPLELFQNMNKNLGNDFFEKIRRARDEPSSYNLYLHYLKHSSLISGEIRH